jgi:hypothetical protein
MMAANVQKPAKPKVRPLSPKAEVPAAEKSALVRQAGSVPGTLAERMNVSEGSSPGGNSGAPAFLRNLSPLQQGLVWSEILGTPKALQT